MITFGQQKTRFHDIAKTDSSVTVDDNRAERMINDVNQSIIGMEDWYFLEKERTTSFVADQNEYQLPADYGRMKAVWVDIDDTLYSLEEVVDLDYWQDLNSTSASSDITERFLILEDSIRLYPTPSSTSGTLHMVYRQKDKDMSADDYTTGTIAATAGSLTVTGSATSWTSAMAGRFIEINGRWYEIDSASATSITLVKYALDTVSGESYTIGEASAIPDEFHDLLWKGAVADFYDFKGEQNPWRRKYEQRLLMFIRRYGSGQKTTGQVLRRTGRSRSVNPNDYPTGLSE